ncbi:amino acid adenylation domain-containing protein [Nostoc sp. WHI]|uniref:amino acid adenylation domain-containing protein n=1 Tax=Nostoc sp. WHI TaxID=2650611 RepID=UPI0018C5289B|nr:amino acid adenylation domain-containing protein [Nostoc sp. WHI]MBG1268947.1 amino acid adenylation domain-containing protein [Nostoc sp. WHI]
MQTQDLTIKKLDNVESEDLMVKSLLDLFLEQVQAQPDTEAVICDHCDPESITYRELAEISSRLGSYLQHLGAAVDECVGIFVEPSLELVIGIWGILFSGSAYLPLSPEYPEDRLRYMVEDAGVKIVFSQEKLRVRLAELVPPGTRIVTLEESEEFEIPSGTNPQNGLSKCAGSDNLAYVIYTSGSTGKPKGVMIEHRSIINQMSWMRAVYKLDQSKVILQKTPMSFDAAQWEILASCCGSKVIMSIPGVYKDSEKLIESIIRHDVTTVQCVPTLLQALLDTDIFHNCKSITQIFSGGEILSKKLALQCIEVLPKCDLINVYGPSECTINASAFKVDKNTIGNYPEAIPIGTPVHNTQFYIFNSDQSLAQIGEIGELYIGGVQLARGYLNRPDLSKEKFINKSFSMSSGSARLYKTGDLASWNADGTVQFVGRVDNQVKLRGFRIELDEVKVAIEKHDWVKNAAVIVKKNSRTGYSDLIACIELSPKQAAVMDQGVYGEHHLSKKNKLQVKAQLSNLGYRDIDEENCVPGQIEIDLPGKTPTEEQRRLAFTRKSYRLFEGGAIQKADIMQLLDRQITGTETYNLADSRGLDALSFTELGQILRYFGPFHSDERLLPKYGYASPGALYATQMYLELVNIAGLKSGYYYYHPGYHQLVLLNEIDSTEKTRIKIHFIGKRKAIELVYKNNIQEVLEIETGHILGLFDKILPAYNLRIGDSEYMPDVKEKVVCADEYYYYLGSFDLVPQVKPLSIEPVDIYVQSHPGKIADLPTGLYKYKDSRLEKISDDIILKRHVIAINQLTYEQGSFGITMIGRNSCKWANYFTIGRKLQHLQMNDLNLGLLSSGYSSETGNDLPSAKQITKILTASHEEPGPSYFCIGGRVSHEQLISEGMKEDAIQMKGPAELIKEDIYNFLPDYMVPNKIIVMDKLPLTANGKIDVKALEASDKVNMEMAQRPIITPRTNTEQRIGEIWKKAMKWDSVSICDDFFESGGNSLIAVRIINAINKEFHCVLPLHALFEASTIEKLARKIDSDEAELSSRLVPLSSTGENTPVYCWPGLGGYPMNLRLLAEKININRPFYGVQSYGINQGEKPFSSVSEMATEDIKEIKRIQPVGPYTLWGYSFGARVAFEVAYQLEQSGEQVENLFLIAPGSPKVRTDNEAIHSNQPVFTNKAYVTILFSVFASTITGPALEECLQVAKDEDSFASFISRYKKLDLDLVERIMKIVQLTYEAKYTFRELALRQIVAPITIFKADGDDYSFIESYSGHFEKTPTVINLEVDHYSLLKITGISKLVSTIDKLSHL